MRACNTDRKLGSEALPNPHGSLNCYDDMLLMDDFAMTNHHKSLERGEYLWPQACQPRAVLIPSPAAAAPPTHPKKPNSITNNPRALKMRPLSDPSTISPTAHAQYSVPP